MLHFYRPEQEPAESVKLCAVSLQEVEAQYGLISMWTNILAGELINLFWG